MILSTIKGWVGSAFHLRGGPSEIQRSSVFSIQRELLAVVRSREDHIVLIGIFAGTPWRIRFADCLENADRIIRQNPIGVVLYDRDVPGVDWRDAAEILGAAPTHPRIILLCSGSLPPNGQVLNCRNLLGTIVRPLLEKEIVALAEKSMSLRNGESTSTRSDRRKYPTEGISTRPRER